MTTNHFNKRLVLMLAAVFIGTISSALAQRGEGVFKTGFDNDATGRNDMNTYLLCYLETLVYPEGIQKVAGNQSDDYEAQLHKNKNGFFKEEYKKYTKYLFDNPDYEFVTESSTDGYDPEAMVISTPATVFVVFRGTDRVATNKLNSFQYTWNEWITSDFDLRKITAPEEQMTGQLLRGFWTSLTNKDFIGQLEKTIKKFGGATKKVWICGHSLGSGQAQLAAMYLSRHGINVHGLYAFAAPHPGDQKFVDALNKLLPGGRFQRFDFISDPITMLPPAAMGFGRAGTRVYYNDVKTIEFNAGGRGDAELVKLIPALGGAAANAALDHVKLDNIFGMSGFCYHHPRWYLQAAFNQLTTAQKAKVPAPLSIPGADDEACDRQTVIRGMFANPVQQLEEEGKEVVKKVKEGLEKLAFTAKAIIDNVKGSSIDEGYYYIKSYASDGKLGLNEVGDVGNGTSMKLSTSRSKVYVKRDGSIGYSIRFGTKKVPGLFGDRTLEYVLDSKAEELVTDDNGKLQTHVQLWEKLGSPNQRWLFIKLKEHKYVILCLANMRVLDANNNCVDDNECRVKTFAPIDNDQTQVWIVEKAN